MPVASAPTRPPLSPASRTRRINQNHDRGHNRCVARFESQRSLLWAAAPPDAASFPISLKIGPTGQDEVTPVSFAGHLGTADLSAGISELAAKLDQGGRYLVDFRHCAIEATAAEFMGLIDHWFTTLGTDTPMAVLMDGQAQGDHAMLFETRGFLLGSQLKAFTSLFQARDWLAGKGQPGNRPSLQTR